MCWWPMCARPLNAETGAVSSAFRCARPSCPCQTSFLTFLGSRVGVCVCVWQGMAGLRDLLTVCGTDESKMMILHEFSSAIRDSMQFEPRATAHVHYLNCLSGCGEEARGAVMSGFSELLRSMVELLKQQDHRRSGPLVARLLRTMTLDYDSTDHAILLDSGLLLQLRKILYSDRAEASAAACGLLRLLLVRSMAQDHPSNMQGVTPLMAELRDIVLDRFDHLLKLGMVVPEPEHVEALEQKQQGESASCLKLLTHPGMCLPLSIVLGSVLCLV